jgi:hypothetical protein
MIMTQRKCNKQVVTAAVMYLLNTEMMYLYVKCSTVDMYYIDHKDTVEVRKCTYT